jgi:hypothetical protein
VAVLALLGLGVAVSAQRNSRRYSSISSAEASGPPPSPNASRKLLGPGVTPPLVLTYFFYWYDAQTKQHLRPQDGLPTHLPTTPAPSWRSSAWFERQLRDMRDATIDVALPVYWGSSPQNEWSVGGLAPLVAARHRLVAAHFDAPRIGMFYDTSIVRGVNLTATAGIDEFYANIRTFFRHIPRSDWALVDNRPIVWIFLPQDNRFDQRVFDATYTRFADDFGVRPYIVRATGWDCASTAPNCEKPIHTDASYVWGVAQDGMQATRMVAAAGPGYDDRQVSGRKGTYVGRDHGAYYRKNLTAAVQSGRPLVALETWNEIHEASGIGQTVEYGRDYIEMTRSIVDSARGKK